MKTRKCYGCKRVRELNKFARNRSNPAGYAYQCLECKREYYRKNREKLLAQKKEYYQKNKDKFRQRDKLYRENNREKYNLGQQRHFQKLKKTAYQILTDGKPIRCVMQKKWDCCNGDPDFLSLDHIKGDGAKHRREIGYSSGSKMYQWVISNPKIAKSKLQILCMNAQIKKRRINQENKKLRKVQSDKQLCRS